MASRTENSIRNTVTALVGQVATLVLSFITRTIFIKYLGASYLGINGLFSNILSVLSFAELGFGTAIIYALYKPIAENDQRRIVALMNFYAMVYRFIGIFILVVGLLLIPNLTFFIGDTSEIPKNLPPLWLIYVLYLFNSAVSYFFNYKRSLITASQNGHIDSINTLFFTIVRNIFQILILIIWRAFVPYLIVQIICTFLGNVFISIEADKLFPYLKQYKDEHLDKESIKSILKNVMAMACHKLGSVIVSGTDNILISKFVGVIATGYYSNYTLLTGTVKTFYVQIFSPITASVGNLVAEKSKDKSYDLFNNLLFVNAYIAVFCTTCLTTLINPFIRMLWGEEYVFGMHIVIFIMINFFVTCMRQTSCMYIDTNGLFWQVKWKSVVEALINLIASVFLAKQLKWGVLGVIIGTTISTFMTNFWWEPYVVYKYAFERSLKDYFGNYLKYSVCVVFSIAVSFLIESWMPDSLAFFVLRCVVSVCIPNVLIFLFYRNTSQFKYLIIVANRVLNKIMKKV